MKMVQLQFLLKRRKKNLKRNTTNQQQPQQQQPTKEAKGKKRSKYYPSHMHEYFENKKDIKGVTIKKGAYLGFGSIILPGVTIGEQAIIGAGTVISRDVPDHATVIGQSPKIIRKNHTEEPE